MMESRNNNRIAISASDWSLELLYLGANNLIASARVLLEPGIISDGSIKHGPGLVAKLNQGIKQLQQNGCPASAKEVMLSLPENKCFCLTLEQVASTEAVELEAKVRLALQASLPLELNNLNWDYFSQPASWDKNVAMAAASKKELDSWRQALVSANLSLVLVDAQPISLARALLEKRAVPALDLIINCGAVSSDLSFFDESSSFLQAVAVPVGTNLLDAVLAEKLGITLAEAEKQKSAKGVSQAEILPLLTKMVKHSAKAVAFAEAKYQRQVKQIILAGGGAVLPGLNAYLQKELGRPVSFAKPFIKLGIKNRSGAEELYYANAIGLALLAEHAQLPHFNLLAARRAAQEVNKRPVPQKHVALTVPTKTIFLSLLLLCVIIILIVFLSRSRQVAPTAGPPPETNALAPDAMVETHGALLQAVAVTSSTTSSLPTVEETVSVGTSTLATGTPPLQPEKSVGPDSTQAKVLPTPTGFLNVRASPSTQAAIVQKITPGDEFLVVGQQSDWYELQLSGQESGWANAKYLQLIK
jgi:Tfp pilus assembly PilM family ATPase